MNPRIIRIVALSCLFLLTTFGGISLQVSGQNSISGPGPNADMEAVMRFKENLRSYHKAGSLSALLDAATPQLNMFAPTAGELDPAFDPFLATYVGQIRAAVLTTDGQLLIGGKFISLNGVTRYNIARFNLDGSLDPTFSPRISDEVTAITLQPDGKILVGGRFTFVNGESRNRVARLNSDGALDSGFDPGGGTDNVVYDIALQADGKIIVAGFFTYFNGVTRGNIVRIDSNGSLDSSFVTSTNSTVFSIAIQTDSKILIGGNFTTVNGANSVRLARLDASNGALDPQFLIGTGTNGTVFKIRIAPDGKIMIGGAFTTYKGATINRIARLTVDGNLDPTFSPLSGASSTVNEITLLPSGKMLLGGSFAFYNGLPSSRMVQINSNGTLDTTFNPGTGFAANLGAVVYAIRVLPNGSYGVGGFFTQYNGVNRDIAAVLDPNGALDPDFSLSTLFQANLRSVMRQSDPSGQKVVMAGTFNRVNGVISSNIARVNLNGVVDPTFNIGTGANGEIYAMTPVYGLFSTQIMIAGNFTNYNGVSRNRIARLNSNGSLDTTFNPGTGANGFVSNVRQTSLGKIFITGSFTAYNGTPRPGIASLNSDGSLDTTFNPAAVPSGSFFEGTMDTGTKIIAGGFFSFGGFNSLVRFNADGSIDNSFTPATELNSGVYSLAPYYTSAEPKILIGGTFTTVGGVTQHGIARLNADGTRDTSFNVGSGTSVGDDVEDIETRPFISGGVKIYLGGLINSINGVPKHNIARLNDDGSPDPSFGTTADNRVWDIEEFNGNDEERGLLICGDFFAVNDIPRTGAARLLIEPINNTTISDFDGDGRSDISVFRPSSGAWYLQQSTDGFRGLGFGSVEDRIVQADYEGDGKADIAVYRPSTGIWYVLHSSDGTVTYTPFGIAEDIPTPADYDGDGQADISVFRPSTGTWYRINTRDGSFAAAQFGTNGDKPALGDFDGDGKADLSVFRPSTGAWYQTYSSNGSFFGEQFGISTDKITPADYDGDGKTDIAIYRPSEGLWYVKRSATTTYVPYVFGLAADIPVPGDFDGDGKADIGVFRPSDGTWYIVNSSNASYTIFQFGQNGDRPTQSAFNN